MRYITGTLMSALLVCAVNAQQTNQTIKNVQTQTVSVNSKQPLNKTETPHNPNEISATRAVICMNVTNLEPENIGDTFPPEVIRLYCFTQIKSSGEPAEIQHRWYWKDELMGSVSLKINSANFRTHSAKSIPSYATGDWRVAIVNTHNEEVIQVIKFIIK